MRRINSQIKLGLSAIFVICAALSGPSGSQAQTVDVELSAMASFKPGVPVGTGTAIEIVLSRHTRPAENIAVTLDRTDISSLFRKAETRLIYDPALLPLPVGDSTVTLYAVSSAGSWKEIARLPISVKNAEASAETAAATGQASGDTVPVPGGPEAAPKNADPNEEKKPEDSNPAEAKAGENTVNEAAPAEPKPDANRETSSDTKAPEAPADGTAAPTPPAVERARVFKFTPTFAVSMDAQPFQSNFPADARPEKRATFNDFALTGSIKAEGKIGGLTNESNFDFAGSSFKEKTLQFGTLGREAPDVDLASYLMNFTMGKAKFSLGHTSFGNNRHLVNSFSSRGLSINTPINKYFDVTGGVLNGTSVLGVRNFLGMSEIRHQLQGGTLGIEFFPKRKNALRLEVSGFNGYLQALNAVSEGKIVDAERSRGFGLRLVTSDKTERFKLEAGYALSRFFDAKDTTLDPDGRAVPIPAVIRSAFYIESTNQLLKDVKLTETRTLNLSFGFRYEYVEPLYRSLGASASADKAIQDYSLDGSVGEITFQVAHGRANDNLANIPSILKLLTRSNRFTVALPVSSLMGKPDKPSPFLPRLGYSIDRTNNFGAAIPVNGGFEVDLGTVPDLVNTNQNASSSWQFKRFNVGYTYGRTYADNRQAGSENKDQLGWVHGITVGLNPMQTLAFNVGFTFDNQTNFELDQTNRTKTLNLGTSWQPLKRLTFTGELAQTLAGDAAKTNLTRNVNYSAQLAYTFAREKTGFKKFGAQAFARFADAFARTANQAEISNTRTRTKIMTAGMTFNFF